jgi:Mg-chelatase subunit ChlD
MTRAARRVRHSWRSALVLGFAALGASSIAAACGDSKDSTFDPRSGQGGSAASGASGGNAGNAASGGSLIGAGGTNGTGDSGGGMGGELNADAACATGTVAASLEPVSLFIVLDTSSSMVQNGSTKWTNARQGIRDFVASPTAAGLKVALSYFPQHTSNSPACDGGEYDVADIVPPAGVAMGLLPGNATAITNSVNARATTSNGTPTEAALNGIRRYCTQYRAQHTAERCVGLIVTDGEPNGCSNNLTTLGNAANASFTSNPSIPIYVMGMTGAVFSTLNHIAQRGGTTAAINVNDGGSNAFLNALNQIRGQVMSCDFPIPAGTGGPVDTNRVNIKLVTSSGVTSLGRVAAAAQCVSKAWHYDSETNPRRIVLCPDSCTAARADSSSRIEVILGCRSEPPEIG